MPTHIVIAVCVVAVAFVALWAVVAIVRTRSRPEVQRLKLLGKALHGSTFSEREQLLRYLIDTKSRETTPQEAEELLKRIFAEGRRRGLLE